MNASRKAAAVFALLAPALIAACGDDDTDAATATTAASNTTAASDDAAGGDAGAPTGDPVRLMVIASLSNPGVQWPELEPMASAREEAINAAGGIAGRPVEITVCDDAFDPNKSADCARDAIDGDYTAVVGSVEVFPDVFTLLDDAGVPYIGGDGITPAEMTSETSYPLGSVSNWYYGTAALLVQQEAERPVVIRCDDASCDGPETRLNEALALTDITVAGEATYTLGTADFAAPATTAVENDPDFVVLVGPDVANVRLVPALRQAGYDGPITALAPSMSSASLEQLGDLAEGLFLVSHVSIDPNGSEAEQEFYAEMEGSNPSAQAASTWNAIGFVQTVAEGIDGEVNAASLIEALNNTTDPVNPPLSGPWVAPGQVEAPIPDEPRLAQFSVRIYEVVDGQLEDESDGFFDPIAELEG